MQNKMHTKQKLLSALILGAFASGAGASGFQLIEQNASGLGNAYAGSAAVAENASTVFYNPAGMMELKDREASFGLTAIKPSFKFKDSGTSVGLTGTGNGGDAGSWGYVPNGYMSLSYSKDLRFGIGIGAPFGLMTKYDKPWVGAAQSDTFDVKTLNINPSVAFRVSDKVSVGGGVNWQRLDAEYLRTAGLNTTAQLLAGYGITSVNVQNSMSRLSLGGESWGWNAGTLIKLSPDTKLGVSYRSKVKYLAEGTATVTGPKVAFNQIFSSSVKAYITLPDTFIASLTHELNPNWQLLGDVSWTGWSSIPKIDIDRTSGAFKGQTAQTLDTQFRDTWRVAFGANYKLNDDWKLKTGIAYDQTPVKGEATRLVSMPDNDRLWLSVGAQWKVAKDSTLDFGMAYLHLKDAKINNNQLLQNRGTVSGTYQDKGFLFGAQYSAAF